VAEQSSELTNQSLDRSRYEGSNPEVAVSLSALVIVPVSLSAYEVKGSNSTVPTVGSNLGVSR
jgi:hypothetical protein